MALSANEAILQLAIRHHVDVMGYSNGLVRSIIGQLNDASNELADMIRKRGEKGPFTTARLKALVEAVNEMVADSHAELLKETEKPLKEFAEHEAESTVSLLTKATPIALDIVTPDIEKLKVMVTDSAIHGHLLKEWFGSLESSMAQKVTQQIRLGVIEGEGIDKIVRRLTGAARDYEAGIFAIVRRQTEAVVRTAVMGVSNQAMQATYAANKNIIKSVKWTSTLDGSTTPICQARDGNVYPVDSGPRPPAHFQCRSVCVPLLKSWRELGLDIAEMPDSTRASMNGQVPEKVTYGEWLKGQDYETQKEALGATRAALFRKGELDVKDFVNNKGQVYDLKTLKAREEAAFAKVFPQ